MKRYKIYLPGGMNTNVHPIPPTFTVIGDSIEYFPASAVSMNPKSHTCIKLGDELVAIVSREATIQIESIHD